LIATGQYRHCCVTDIVYQVAHSPKEGEWFILWLREDELSSAPFNERHLLEDRLLSSLEVELI
jgi:hypothetical protein